MWEQGAWTCTSFGALAQRVLVRFQKLDPQSTSTVLPHSNAPTDSFVAPRPAELGAVKVTNFGGEYKLKITWFLTRHLDLQLEYFAST